MRVFSDNIRKPVYTLSFKKQILNTFFVFLFGFFLGYFSKFLDCTASNELPYLIEKIDLRNFFSRLAIWLLLALIISIYSNSPLRAGINVFLFYAGMLISYYAYTKFFAGFFPINYIMIWVLLTFMSLFLAFICWYAKGEGIIPLFLSAMIIAVLFIQAFSFGLDFSYFDISYQGLEVIVWLVGIAILYKSPKQLALMLSLSFIFAILLKQFVPFFF